MAKDIQPVAIVSTAGGTLQSAAAQTVTTAGTSVQLPDIECSQITLYALSGNTGSIYVGGSDVSSTVFGIELEAKDSITIPVSNANQLYIDASVDGEGVSLFAIQ